MYGYDMGWAAFRMIEVIAQPKFSHKRIGYLAASQCFNEHTDVMVLATNLIRKVRSSPDLASERIDRRRWFGMEEMGKKNREDKEKGRGLLRHG